MANKSRKSIKKDFEGNVAAIDFGTTFCSLAFCVTGCDIESLKINGVYDRVPTAILLKKKREQNDAITVIDIGFNAQQRYKNLPAGRYEDHLYFECFKMQLRDETKLTRNLLIPAFAGKNYYIIEIIALVLQHLKSLFDRHLSMAPHRKDGHPLQARDFHWVLTVPAIWKDRGKQMMREAAYKAGLLAEVTPITSLTIPPKTIEAPNIPPAALDKLVLALEPECAALYCQQLNCGMVAKHCDRLDDVTSNRYMVLDIGGGTVDIAIHNLEADTSINSVLPPTGNDWGGTTVNREFSVLVQNIINDENFESFYTSPNNEPAHKAIITNLVFQDFEQPKKDFGEIKDEDDDDDFDDVCITLDHKFVKFYQLQTVKKKVQPGVELNEGTLCIKNSKMEEFFQPAASGILNCMNSALEVSSVTVDTIYLVGGFGGCPYIYQRVRDATKGKEIRVVVPAHHKIAVAQGAVIYRQKMSAVKSRMSDAYYGIALRNNYDPDKHDESRRFYNEFEKRYKVDYNFKIFVQKNQPIKWDDKFEHTVYSAVWQSTVLITVYRTFLDGVKYVCEANGDSIPGIEELGHVVIPTPLDDLEKNDRKIKVTFEIGGTELKLRAAYGPTKQEVDTKIDFLS